MRRGKQLLGVLALVACGLIWYWQRAEPTPSRSGSAIENSETDASGSNPVAGQVSKGSAAVTDQASAPTAGTSAEADVRVKPDAGGSDEDPVIVQIRESVINEPKLAEDLASEDQERFPNSPNADERDALFVAAVFNQGQIDRARVEARRYFRRHPGGRYTDYLIRETGVHPPPTAVPGKP